jgi:ankyrin repeat protein
VIAHTRSRTIRATALTLRAAALLAGVTLLVAASGAVEPPDEPVTGVNHRYADGSTPLQWAVYNGDAAEVKQLLDAGADVTLANDYGASPMSLAAEVADTDVLELLLAAGADVDSPNPEGQTALMAVARTGNLAAAELLIDHGASIDARENWGGQTALMWASARRHPPMMELLLSHGAAIDARSTTRDYQRHVQAEGRPKNLDTGGFTPLLYAARENCLACVDVLLANGADINLPDPDGVSPLHVAIMNANWDLAKRLIEAGADVNQWDIYGEAPLYTAIGLYTRINGGRPSIDALNETAGLDIVHLLLDRGADPNMQLFFKPAGGRGATSTRGSTPLIRAANGGDQEMVELLLDNGADPTIYLADRQTPIHAVLAGRSSEEQALELIRIFYTAGTDIDIVALVNHREEVRGGTALHYAVRKRYQDVIRELASYGIDLDAVDQDGLTALDYTQSRGFMPFMALQTPSYDEEAALLREFGASREIEREPLWPVLGPPQGVWADIWPIGEPTVYPPIYTHAAN